MPGSASRRGVAAFPLPARVLVLLACVSLGLMVFSPTLAEFLLFQPSRGDPGPPPTLYRTPGKAISLLAADGVRIQAWWYEVATGREAEVGAGTEEVDMGAGPTPRPAVLFFHGNAGDISSRTPIAEGLLREGLSVLLLEYRGYGGSEGSPSEAGLSLDAEAGYTFLLDELGDAKRIVIFGRSLGGAVAARLAASVPSGGLILEAAFTSLEDMGRVLYPILPGFFFHRLKGRYSTIRWVRQVDVPLLVIHGTEDEVVPTAHGRALMEAGNQPKEWLGVEGARHNDVFWVGGPLYFGRIGSFARECAKGGSLGEGPAPGQ